ncbi:MAG: hypothetical protein WBO70_04110 [Erysipelotrichaceae bacterium]
MPWYLIVLIVIVVLFVLLFVVYITNADLKLVEKTYNSLLKYQENRKVDTKI